MEAKAVEAREEERVEIPIGRVEPGALREAVEETTHHQRSRKDKAPIRLTVPYPYQAIDKCTHVKANIPAFFQ